MGEEDSLVFLANVALDKQNDLSTVCHRKRNQKTKELKITHLNGTDIAEFNDLKNLPISMLSKIFMEKSEDTILNCTVYICKFGVQYDCNTKFMDAKENKVYRLEHLIRCHLLEHLMKTKSGTFIKIPKKFIENMRTNNVLKPIPQSVILKKSNGIQTSNSNIASNDDHHVLKKLALPTTADKCQNSHENIQEIAEFCRSSIIDHSYARMKEKLYPKIPASFDKYPLIKTDICFNKLFQVNAEPSKELISFMMYETLHQPLNIFIIDGTQLIVEELPIVGSEVEVSTNYDFPVNNKNLVTIKDEAKYSCSFCPSTYLTRKSLNLHFRRKHNKLNEPREKGKVLAVNSTTCNSKNKTNKKSRLSLFVEDTNNNSSFELKENWKLQDDLKMQNNTSILKTELIKNTTVKRPIVNISNVWNNINVQYI